jgi:endonuclease/exonuclease/phosphatase family metal-dependent hydrolase
MPRRRLSSRSANKAATEAAPHSATPFLPQSSVDAWCTLAELQGVDATAPSVQRAAVGMELLRRDSVLARQIASSGAAQIQPGEVVHCNYLSLRDAAADAVRDADASRPLRLVQWNIERGYKLAEIIALLLAQDADVIALQELDIGCARSGWNDNLRSIAAALKMNAHFVAEFKELYSPLRPADCQGGGVHGNALLSRFEHAAVSVVPHAESFSWAEKGHHKREPRLGGRFSIAADVLIPTRQLRHKNKPTTTTTPLRCWSVHMEVFAGGPLARLACLGELFAAARRDYSDATAFAAAAAAGATSSSSLAGNAAVPASVASSTRRRRRSSSSAAAINTTIASAAGEGGAQPYGPRSRAFHQAILGDFNTLSHGIARFSSSYCTDALRWGSLGHTEAEWITRHVLHHGEDDPPERFLRRFLSTNPTAATIATAAAVATAANPFDATVPSQKATAAAKAVGGPLTAAILKSLANPGFVCPFDAYECSTLTNYRGWFNGKLDWMLLRNLTTHAHFTANDDFHASDHKMLVADMTFDAPVFVTSGGSSSSAAVDAYAYPAKSSAELARLMPLRRPRPGLVTSSASRAVIYLPQIAAFWIIMLLAAWTVVRNVA